MVDMKQKTRLISDFFGGAKSQKLNSSSSPHLNEPQVNVGQVNDQNIPIQEEVIDQVVPSTPFQNASTERDNGNDVNLFPLDPGTRVPISSYPFNDQDVVRRGFIAQKACQPRNHPFPQTSFGIPPNNGMRTFKVDWYDKYDWLEYSVEKDAVFCFVCYLFTDKTSVGAQTFVSDGFRGSNRAIERFERHIGQSVDSAHKKALEKYHFFINPKSSIAQNFNKTSKEASILYKARLTESLECSNYLLRQGLAFRGHDESESSPNKGNFLELLEWLARKDENVNKIVLKNAPGNDKMICHDVQTDLINSCAKETTKLILEELGDGHFSILADESSDVSYKEQLAICLCFVEKKGSVCERFLGIIEVKDTCSLSLQAAITKMITNNKLTMSRIRGQGYCGASNMRGEISGLKTLIMKDTPSAYYVHCFAHQLQLTLVAVARINDDCKWFFDQIGFLLNVIGVSCKRRDMLRVVQAQNIIKALDLGEIESGRGLNQELTLIRPGDTRWGSHFRTILNIIALYPSIFEVLLMIGKNGHHDDRVKAQTVMLCFDSFQFVFMARLMIVIFGYTDELCQALQKKDQDIVNAMAFVKLTKDRLQKVREAGWENFLGSVTSYCVKNKVKVRSMDTKYRPPGRSKRYFEKATNDHRFRVELFNSVLDLQLQELNDRFDEVNTELLLCMACFSPSNAFEAFDKQKLIRLAEFYPEDFSSIDLMRLEFQLDHFIDDMRKDTRFENLQGLGQLSMKLVATNKHSSYKLVYLLLSLVLILPVATASVERVFSAMTYVKNKLRNSMGGPLLNNSLVTFIEKDFFSQIKNDDVLHRFQGIRSRRFLLPDAS